MRKRKRKREKEGEKEERENEREREREREVHNVYAKEGVTRNFSILDDFFVTLWTVTITENAI